MLASVEVLLDGGEVQPMHLLSLRRDIDLVKDVAFSGSPEQSTEDRLQSLSVTSQVGLKKT